jgi:hypothetical protein
MQANEWLLNMAAASLSAGFSAFVVAPADTLRVRWQVVSAAAGQRHTTGSLLQFGATIAAREGVVRGLLLPGLAMNVAAIAACSGIRFTLYPSLRDFIGGKTKSPSAMMLSGFATGGLAYGISAPL